LKLPHAHRDGGLVTKVALQSSGERTILSIHDIRKEMKPDPLLMPSPKTLLGGP
jgi:hypothetical protein